MKLTLLLWLLFAGFENIFAMNLSPYEMLVKAGEYRFTVNDFSFNVEIDDLKNGVIQRTTRFKVLHKMFGKNAFSLTEVTFPERRRGTKLLMRENDLWIYLPAIRRPTRVSSRERLTGEVSNGDIAKTNYAEDYTGTVLGKEKINNIDCVKLSLLGKNLKSVTYAKIIYWIKSETYMPIKADFYALSGKILKSAIYSELKPMLGRTFVTKMLITDYLQPSKQSVLVYSNFRNEKLSESVFNKDSIAR